jgi:hypothetical protein
MTVDMRAELSQLSSDAIVLLNCSLRDACSMCDATLGGSGMIQTTLDILWDRHAIVGGIWWRRTVRIGNQLIRNQAIWDMPEREAVGFCGAGDMPTGSGGSIRHDRRHVIKRSMAFSSHDHNGRVVNFGGLECSCGRRSDRHVKDKMFLDVRWYLCHIQMPVWPVVTSPGLNDGSPCYQVCRDAPFADHQGHAPNCLGDRCLCGRPIGEYYDSESDGNVCTDQFMPVQ